MFGLHPCRVLGEPSQQLCGQAGDSAVMSRYGCGHSRYRGGRDSVDHTPVCCFGQNSKKSNTSPAVLPLGTGRASAPRHAPVLGDYARLPAHRLAQPLDFLDRIFAEDATPRAGSEEATTVAEAAQSALAHLWGGIGTLSCKGKRRPIHLSGDPPSHRAGGGGEQEEEVVALLEGRTPRRLACYRCRWGFRFSIGFGDSYVPQQENTPPSPQIWIPTVRAAPQCCCTGDFHAPISSTGTSSCMKTTTSEHTSQEPYYNPPAHRPICIAPHFCVSPGAAGEIAPGQGDHNGRFRASLDTGCIDCGASPRTAASSTAALRPARSRRARGEFVLTPRSSFKTIGGGGVGWS